jgi:hypothetical protein
MELVATLVGLGATSPPDAAGPIASYWLHRCTSLEASPTAPACQCPNTPPVSQSIRNVPREDRCETETAFARRAKSQRRREDNICPKSECCRFAVRNCGRERYGFFGQPQKKLRVTRGVSENSSDDVSCKRACYFY